MSASYFPPIISSIYLEELAGQAIDAKDAALVALNAANAARDTALEYRNDAHTYYTQVQQIQEGDYVTNLSLEDRLSTFNFADLKDIPATFKPSAHGHTWSEIINKPTMYPPTVHGHAWGEITGKPTEFEPLPHIHTWQQIAQKPGTFPPETHFHSWNEIENKPNVFNPAAHTHSWGDISGKPSKFDPAEHTHTWDLIENKPLTFPPQSHHHNWSQVTGKPEQATRWPNYSEVAGTPVLGTASSKNVGVDADDVMGVGAFGVGSLDCLNISNLETEEVKSGLYKFRADTNGSPPETFGSNLWFLCEVIQGHQDRVTFDAKLVTGSVPRHFIGQRLVKTGPITWVENFNTGNLNVDEFDAGEGYAANSTIVWINLNLNNVDASTGISVSGTFSLLDSQGAVVRTGILPSEISFVIGTQSSSICTVRVSNNQGLNINEPYYIKGESPNSKIRVNS